MSRQQEAVAESYLSIASFVKNRFENCAVNATDPCARTSISMRLTQIVMEWQLTVPKKVTEGSLL